MQMQKSPRRNRRGSAAFSFRTEVARSNYFDSDFLNMRSIFSLVRIAASLAGLSSLQRLVGGALRAVSRRPGGLSGAGCRISSSLRSCGILHCLVGSCLDLVDRLLRYATAGSDEGESSNTCLQRGGDGVLHNFFPLHTGSDKKGPERLNFTASKSVRLMACSRGYRLRSSLFVKAAGRESSAEDTRLKRCNKAYVDSASVARQGDQSGNASFVTTSNSAACLVSSLPVR